MAKTERLKLIQIRTCTTKELGHVNSALVHPAISITGKLSGIR